MDGSGHKRIFLRFTLSPFLFLCRSILAGDVLGLGYALAAPSAANLVDAAGQFHDLCEVSLPFYDPGKRRPRGGWREDLLPEGGPHSFDR